MQIILGKPWIFEHGCSLNFAESRMQFTIANTAFNVPMRTTTSATNSSIQRPKPRNRKHLTNTTINFKPKQVWRRKVQAQSKSDSSTEQTRSGGEQHSTQVWIRKSLLQAQGFYTGKAKIWVPKTVQPPQKPLQKAQFPLKISIPESKPRPTSSMFNKTQSSIDFTSKIAVSRTSQWLPIVASYKNTAINVSALSIRTKAKILRQLMCHKINQHTATEMMEQQMKHSFPIHLRYLRQNMSLCPDNFTCK